MNPLLFEDLLKGLFLGLWAYLAVAHEPQSPDWPAFTGVLLWTGGGLVLGLAAGALVQFRRGYKPAANPKAFPLVVLLESPFWIQVGILGGLFLGLVIEQHESPRSDWLAACAAGGLILGFGFHQLRNLRDPLTRILLACLVGGLLIYVALNYIDEIPGFTEIANRRAVGWVILAGLPFFWLLTFCGEAEESEIEIAALCAGLGIGLSQLTAGRDSLLTDKLILLVPLAIYIVYVVRFLPGLRVFKHTLRGYTALNLNRHLDALLAFRRALALKPKDELAVNGLWDLHQRVDVANLPPDSPILEHLDYDFCLNQSAAYLIGARSPTEVEREKAVRMLDLVERRQPPLAARVDYLRAIALTHAKRFDEAARLLSRLLDPETLYEVKSRNPVLFDAWSLALRLHPELAKRLGEAELVKPGRRMQAIGAAHRRLVATPSDAAAAEMQALLYAGLSEAEFVADAASGPPSDFNYDYAEQVGLALIEKTQLDRGMAFLRIAGRGLPERGPGIFSKLAELVEQQPEAARGYREQVKRCGQQVGVDKLAADQKPLYFTALKRLAADAEARGDFEQAVADYRLWLESGAGELEGFRKLADLYERGGDPMNALLMTETALVYSKTDTDLLARKDRYYYSVPIEKLQAVKNQVERFFDVDYCLNKAKQVIDRGGEGESLDWALHLARLAKVIKPNDVAVQLAEARVLLRRGERATALQILEDIRELQPSGSNDDAWYTATQILGDLYANELERPDLAVHCYLAYRNYSKSGADTLFNIAKCYEAGNDVPRAIKFYEAVTAYEQHPKYWDAKQAIERLKG